MIKICLALAVVGGVLGRSKDKREAVTMPYNMSDALKSNGTTEMLEREIVQDLEEAEKQMDYFYDMQENEELRHAEFFGEMMMKARQEVRTLFADFMETIQRKMNANMSLVEEEVRKHMERMERSDKKTDGFDEFKRLIYEYIENERTKRGRMDNLKLRKDSLLRFIGEMFGDDRLGESIGLAEENSYEEHMKREMPQHQPEQMPQHQPGMKRAHNLV